MGKGVSRDARRFVSLAVLCGCALTVSSARADGGIPRAYEILFEPGKPSHMLVRSEYWGLFDHRDGMNGWSLYCGEAYGGRALSQDKMATVLTEGGRIIVAASFDGLHASDDGCTWRPIGDFPKNAIAETIAPVDDAGKSFVMASDLGTDGGVVTTIYKSTDRGDTWKPLRAFPGNFSAQSIAVAPSDPQRIYIVGVKIADQKRWVVVSRDGGASWQLASSIDVPRDEMHDQAKLRIMGVHPTRPDVLLVRLDGFDDSTQQPVPDEIYSSGDAGSTWIHLMTAVNDLPGIAFSTDGKRVLVAGPGEGIKVAQVDDVIAKPGGFTQVFAGNVWSLKMLDGKLYAGNDDFTPRGTPRRMVGVSTDEGVTFTDVMNHCEVVFPTCAPTSTMETNCREQWTRQGGWVTDYADMSPCSEQGGAAGAAGAAGASAGGAPSAGAVGSGGAAPTGGTGGGPVQGSSSGCSCVLGGAPWSSVASVLACAAAFAQRWRVRASRRKTRRI